MFRPTAFDPPGLNLAEQQDWLVAPVLRHRDAEPLEASNFHVALQALGGESEMVEVHRFNHWAVGWFEIILIRPGSPAQALGEELEDRLAEHPVLDEHDLAARELDTQEPEP